MGILPWLRAKKLTPSLLFSWSLKVVLLGIFFVEFYEQNYLMMTAGLVALLIALLPVAISQNYRIHLPWIIDWAVTTSLFIHVVGLLYNLYHDPAWWWWDIMTHFIGTAVIALLAFYITFALDYTGTLKLPLLFIALATITTALAIGALWEIGEFYFDLAFGTNTAIDLTDTIHDLVVDAIAAGATALLGTAYVSRLRNKHHGLAR